MAGTAEIAAREFERAGLVARKAGTSPAAFVDECSVPESAILVGEPHE